MDKEKKKERNRKWKNDNPLKNREHSKKCYIKKGKNWKKASKEYNQLIRKTRSLVDNGIIKKESYCKLCSHNGSIYRIEKHHTENDPYKIVWTCSKCHKNLHAGNITL